MDIDVFNSEGKPIRGEVGELVCKSAWPAMTRGIWKDKKRYIDTYWSRWENIWVLGDWAKIDEDGYWFLYGRSDDTLKVAGKRVGPAEVESALTSHNAVSESAVIGVPDEIKGEQIVCFVVLKQGFTQSDDLKKELKEFVASSLGKALKPKAVEFVRDLPKTRNAKILRRVIRAKYIGEDVGDISSLENPEAVKEIEKMGC
jgi:acetyl-CoA synthetase